VKAALSFAVLALLAACRREPIEVRREPKEEAPAMADMGAKPAGLRWSLPAGWKELPATGMRAAAFEPPQADGKSEVTVVALPGDVGGELANVNRWRGQIGLTPLDEAGLASSRERVAARAGVVAVYDFTSLGDNKSRTVAGMISVRGVTWFFKLSGQEKAVRAAKPAFLKLLRGLKTDEA